MDPRKQQVYLWLAGLFVAALIIGDIMGGRVFRIGSLDLSSGMIAFPITFLITDLLNEFYGPAGARRVTMVGLGAAGFVFVVILVALGLPTSPESPLADESFRTDSQAVDTLVVTGMLFWGAKPLGFILTLARNQYALKVVIAVFFTPVIYALHAIFLRRLGIPETREPPRLTGTGPAP